MAVQSWGLRLEVLYWDPGLNIITTIIVVVIVFNLLLFWPAFVVFTKCLFLRSKDN